jgi:cytochrome c oxidase assembly protein subunit 11
MNDRSNKRLAAKLAIIPLCMFGFGYMLVPLYDVFCEVTGINGKTGVVSKAETLNKEVDTERLITVEFVTNINGALPWHFKPTVSKMKVHPGAMNETVFYAENISDREITGQAVPSVAPAQASRFFDKTECFCFTNQKLAAGEGKEMNVVFVVGTELPEDISTMTLSYTFFEATNPDPMTAKADTGNGI